MKPFGTGAHLAHVPVVQNVKIYGEIVQETEVTTDHGNAMQNTKQVSVRFLCNPRHEAISGRIAENLGMPMQRGMMKDRPARMDTIIGDFSV